MPLAPDEELQSVHKVVEDQFVRNLENARGGTQCEDGIIMRALNDAFEWPQVTELRLQRGTRACCRPEIGPCSESSAYNQIPAFAD
jgi:hypothetical protein